METINMKIDRKTTIARLRNAGATFNLIARGFQISETRVRQIYFNKNTPLSTLLELHSKNRRIDTLIA